MTTAPEAGLGQIEAADPSFNYESFCQWARNAFLTVKQCLVSGDLSEAMGLLTNDMYHNLSLHLEELRGRGAVQIYYGLGVDSLQLAAASHDAIQDQMSMLIGARAAQQVSPEDMAPVTVPVMPFKEMWTFVRSTSASGMNECPRCGAPREPDEGLVCKYCKGPLPRPTLGPGWHVAAIAPVLARD